MYQSLVATLLCALCVPRVSTVSTDGCTKRITRIHSQQLCVGRVVGICDKFLQRQEKKKITKTNQMNTQIEVKCKNAEREICSHIWQMAGVDTRMLLCHAMVTVRGLSHNSHTPTFTGRTAEPQHTMDVVYSNSHN